MAHDDNADDPKVKQLLDPATQADLARWFSLPSFQQLAEQPKPQPVIDEELQAVIVRRDKALAAVDPSFVERLRVRNEEHPETLIRFAATIDVHVDDEFGMLEQRMVDRVGSIAEPREVEISEALRDDLRDCTPQALLRDLHRAVLHFDKTFEIVDFAADQRLDIVAEVAKAMATSWKLGEFPAPLRESRALIDGARALRREPWTQVIPTLRYRTVQE